MEDDLEVAVISVIFSVVVGGGLAGHLNVFVSQIGGLVQVLGGEVEEDGWGAGLVYPEVPVHFGKDFLGF